MSSRASLHAARLIVKPKPSTLSESFAILRYLRTLGEVTRFIKHTGSAQPEEERGKPFADGKEDIYDVGFSTILQKLQDLKSQTSGRDGNASALKFKVHANLNQPDPHDLDPYNVRGLLDRKPSLPPRRFTCKLMLNHENQTGNEHTPRGESTTNNMAIDSTLTASEYSKPFIVDRSSIMSKVLRQIDTPRHLIAGLLPKIDDDDETPHSTTELEDVQTTKKQSKRGTLHLRRERAKVLARQSDSIPFSLAKLYEDALRHDKSDSRIK